MAPVTALIGTPDAISQLNLPEDFSDPQLQDYIDASVGAVEGIKGSIIGQTLVETYDGGRNGIALNHAPVFAVTSVTEAGTVLDASEYTVYSDAGILYRVGGAWSATTARAVSVSYTVGRETVDPQWKIAALIVLQDLWATRLARGGGPPRTGGSAAGSEPLDRANYRLPRRAMELLGMAIPGIA